MGRKRRRDRRLEDLYNAMREARAYMAERETYDYSREGDARELAKKYGVV